MSKAKAYELMASCNDEVIKHLCFWFAVMMLPWGCFQTTLGIALWVCIYNIPLPDRYPVHFIYGFLDLAVGLVEAQTAFALPFGVDAVAKFGGTHGTSSTAPEGSAGFPRLQDDGLVHHAHDALPLQCWAWRACCKLLSLARGSRLGTSSNKIIPASTRLEKLSQTVDMRIRVC